MIKAIGILSVIFWTLLLIGNDDALVYSDVPTAKDRAKAEYYVGFPDFKDIEIVKEGVVDRTLVRDLNIQMWPKGYGKELNFDDFKSLKISDLDLIPENILFQPDRVVVPFSVSLRYQLKGLRGLAAQGTIDTDGAIEIQYAEEGRFFIQLIRFGDSQDSERFGREEGFINEFDGDFVNMVAKPMLTRYFMNKSHQEKLANLIEQNLSRL